MSVLHLHVRRKWFDMIRLGIKRYEFRKVKPYWRKRLVGREYDRIEIRCGYPKGTETGDDVLLVRKWKGVQITELSGHEEFGPGQVSVFAIDVGEPLESPDA